MPNKWVEYVRNYAEQKGMSFACALSNPKVLTAYRKKNPPKSKTPSGKPRGRPRKYATAEEARNAKIENTRQSNYEVGNYKYEGERPARKYQFKDGRTKKKDRKVVIIHDIDRDFLGYPI